jgi:hypothetical protein
MHRWISKLVGVSAAAFVLVGCGQSGSDQAQQQVISYQAKIGQINQAFGRPPANLATSQAMLERAIRHYRGLAPPRSLRALAAVVVAGLQAELQSLHGSEQALAARDKAAFDRAQALGARSRKAVSRALVRIAAIANGCRLDATRC